MAESAERMSYSDIGVRLDLWPIDLTGQCAILREPDFPAARTKGNGVADSTRQTVLCVDDEWAILDSMRLALETAFDIVTATSGPEALELLPRRHVDLVLLDLRMPAMSGEEVLRRLGSARTRPPVIVVSVVRQTETVIECMKLG